MKKRLFALLLGCSSLLASNAQISSGAGYYRVMNAATSRYMTLCDNTSRGVDFTSCTADCGAMQTSKVMDRIYSDPGSVFYLDPAGGVSYNVVGQGTSLYDIINYYIYISPVGSYYKIYQEQKGQRISLTDLDDASYDESYVATTGAMSNWAIVPINTTDNYIGVKPTVSAGGKHYAAVFAGYPYTLGEGMKAYYINKVDEAMGAVVIKELSGTIPAKTPVLIECSSTDIKENQVSPVVSDAAAPSDNQAQGVYFSLGDRWSAHYNSTEFDASKMRVLSLNSDGNLAATTSTEHLSTVMVAAKGSDGQHLTISAIPANSWYIPVSSSAPSELRILTEEQYVTGIEDVKTLPASSTYDVYTLEGVQVKKKASSIADLKKGIYIVNGKKMVIK